MKKYGYKYVLQVPKIKKMIIKTNLEKYGVLNPQKNENVKNKLRKTLLQKYGKDNYFKTNEFKEKSKQTCIEKYGVNNYTKTDEYKEKSKQTCIEKYGVDNYSKTNEYKEKTKQTCLKKYDCQYPSQNADIAELSFKRSNKIKEYVFPSGNIINYQGYENYAIDYLINKNISENDIITSRTKVPEIWYEDTNGKKHRYYVDIFIPSQNKCIEVKSSWTIKASKFVFEKQQSTKQLGYDCEIWVYDKNGKLIDKYL